MLRAQISRYIHIKQSMENFYATHAKSVGLTHMNLSILAFIYLSDHPCTQKEICDYHGYNKQAVNTTIKDFEEKEVICLIEDRTDRRNKHIVLTEKGERYVKDLMKPLLELEKKVHSALSEEEIKLVLDITERVYAAFKNALPEMYK